MVGLSDHVYMYVKIFYSFYLKSVKIDSSNLIYRLFKRSVGIILNSSERYLIIQEELAKLVKDDLIKLSDYKRIMKAHRKYYEAQEREIARSKPIEKELIKAKQINHTQLEQKPVEPEAPKKLEPVIQISDPPVQPKVKPVQKKKTPEETRERNITWLLILGVSFLLISGLVVATSTWDQMGALLKVSTLIGVAVFFLALSGFSEKILNIEKTAFAFLTLGSLLLPIALIAIGYFELFGDYLTLTGDGRFWLGLIVTLVPLPLYIRNAYHTKTRLFVWISFVFLSFTVGFLLAALNVPVDLFFLCMMLFNGGLLYSYHRLRKHDQHPLTLFIRELPAYAQLNLIVSTLLMLFIFDQPVFYSFNILITAFMYMAMVFVYRTKDYQFIFIALFAYGVFQLTEHSFLQSADALIYSLLGIAYLAFAHFMRKDTYARKIFHYTSGIISGIAFLYITYQNAAIQTGERHWIMFLAYLVTAATYIYLAHVTKRKVFSFIAPVFLIIVGTQFWLMAIEPFYSDHFFIFMFVYSIGLFIYFGFFNRFKVLNQIEKTTYITSFIVMILMVLSELALLNFFKVSLMLLITGALAIYVALNASNENEVKMAQWGHSISWLLSIYVLFNEIIDRSQFYRAQLGFAFHIALAGLILIGIHLIWNKRSQSGLARAAFLTGQASYLFAMFQFIGYYSGDENMARPIILLIGIGLTYWLVRYTRRKGLWSLVALVISGFYISLLSPLSIESPTGFVWFMLGLPVIFLLAERYLGKIKPALKIHFFWFAQGFLVFLVFIIATEQMVVSFFGHNSSTLHPIVWLVPIAIYLYTTLTRLKESHLKIALYATLTMVVGMIVSLLSHYELMDTVSFAYKWLLAVVVLVGIWLAVPNIWKRRIEWYLIPFMNVVLMLAIVFTWSEAVWQLLAWFGLIVLILAFLHMRKWTNFNVIPLLFSMTFLQTQTALTDPFANWLLFIVGFTLLVVTGRLFYKAILVSDKHGKITFDWYSIFSVLYLSYAYSHSTRNDHIWLEVITLLGLVSWFFLQSKRISHPTWKNTFITLGSFSILLPYYLIFGEYKRIIPELFHAELKALPLLVLIIYLTNKTWSQYKEIMRHVHTVALVGVTIYLIVDAIGSATIWDALVLGILSIISFLFGMRYQLKSYFFVGIGTLLFNLFYQTRTYWGDLPWWVYLLVVGIIFITIASYNEWKKQNQDAGRLEEIFKKALKKFKQWN